MRRLAPLLAVVWWAQTPLCLLAADASHAHASAEAAATGEQHHHGGHGAADPSAPEGQGAPGDPSCAEHCASLAQALPIQAASPAGVSAAWLALPLDAAALEPAASHLWSAAGPPGQPPPRARPGASVLRL